MNNGKLGKVARALASDPEMPNMGEFSLGYRIFRHPPDEFGFKKVAYTEPLEVSICYKGDREGTEIKRVAPLSTLLKEVEEKNEKMTTRKVMNTIARTQKIPLVQGRKGPQLGPLAGLLRGDYKTTLKSS